MPDRAELLKIKLDMVYRNKDRAASQIRFDELTKTKTNE
jgi:hypothetical protein